MVLDPATKDFKTYAQEFLDRADAVILRDQKGSPAWEQVSLKPVAGRPVFQMQPPPYLTPQIVEFVKANVARIIDGETGVPARPGDRIQ